MKRRLIALCTTLGLLVGAITFAPTASAGTQAVEVCVTIYENGVGLGGDSWTVCGNVLPGTLQNANLSGDTTGLNGGCNTTFGTVSDWNDCVSSFKYENMPANMRLRLYTNSNFGTATTCADANGNKPRTNVVVNDTNSSWRVEGGDC